MISSSHFGVHRKQTQSITSECQHSTRQASTLVSILTCVRLAKLLPSSQEGAGYCSANDRYPRMVRKRESKYCRFMTLYIFIAGLVRMKSSYTPQISTYRLRLLYRGFRNDNIPSWCNQLFSSLEGGSPRAKNSPPWGLFAKSFNGRVLSDALRKCWIWPRYTSKRSSISLQRSLRS